MLDLAGRGESHLRLYRWEPACLSFGRNEPALRRYDRARIDALGLDVVRRPTGGRAVWHADELTYSVACPAERFGTLATAYRTIHEMLASALRSLGADASLAQAPAQATGLDAGACFASPAGGEVLVAGRKVIGSAQLRERIRGREVMLQHGSLLLQGDQSVVSSISRGTPPPNLDSSLGGLTGRPVSFEAAAAAVAEAAGAWAGEWRPVVEAGPFLDASLPHEARFRSVEWTWRR